MFVVILSNQLIYRISYPFCIFDYFFNSFMFNFRILGSVIIAALAKQTEPRLTVATKIPIHHQPRNLQHWVKPLLPTQFNPPAWLWQYFLAVSWWHSTFSRTCKKIISSYHSGHLFVVGIKKRRKLSLCSAKKTSQLQLYVPQKWALHAYFGKTTPMSKKNLERLKQTPVVYASKIN